jgi:hypothetical protein
VGEIGCNTGSVDDIVEGELVNEGARLEQKGQWLRRGQQLSLSSNLMPYLTNTSGRACNNCFDHFVGMYTRSANQGGVVGRREIEARFRWVLLVDN